MWEQLINNSCVNIVFGSGSLFSFMNNCSFSKKKRITAAHVEHIKLFDTHSNVVQKIPYFLLKEMFKVTFDTCVNS